MRLRAVPEAEVSGTSGAACRRPGRGASSPSRMRLSGAAVRPRRELLPGERWFAVQCVTHREAFAATQLRAQDFDVFLPLRPKTWRHAHRLEIRHVPFFPGYLFLVLDLDIDRWRSVNGTLGVKGLVMMGGGSRPLPLPPGSVEALLCEADDGGCLRPGGPLRIGQQVRILAGPFGDLMGELIGLDEAGRVRVLIELLGGRVRASMSRGEVVATR
jgi:transcription antitermination factor NusG